MSTNLSLPFKIFILFYLVLIHSFIHSFLAVLGLCCCLGFSLVAASGGYSLVAVSRLLIVLASLVVERSL